MIGSSTGGPEALATVLTALPAALSVPVLVTQHIPPVFSRQLADRLNVKSQVTVREAVDGEPLAAGTVYLAPGDWHLRVKGRASAARVSLDQSAQENFCRPAVDVLFRSAAEVFGAHVLSVVLTGMGSDGALGSLAVAKAGGQVIAQDEATSVVWGMPGAVASTGTANQILALDRIAGAVITRCQYQRTAAGPTGPVRPAVSALGASGALTTSQGARA